jgi:hypothetical protein
MDASQSDAGWLESLSTLWAEPNLGQAVPKRLRERAKWFCEQMWDQREYSSAIIGQEQESHLVHLVWVFVVRGMVLPLFVPRPEPAITRYA